MGIFRAEARLNDDGELEVVQIEQIAYRNEHGDVLVMDATDSAPDGFLPFTPAPSPPKAPSVVTMRQARLALLDAGKLDDVTEMVAALGSAAQIEWEYAQTVDRTHPLVQALDLTEAELDDLFVLAASK